MKQVHIIDCNPYGIRRTQEEVFDLLRGDLGIPPTIITDAYMLDCLRIVTTIGSLANEGSYVALEAGGLRIATQEGIDMVVTTPISGIDCRDFEELFKVITWSRLSLSEKYKWHRHVIEKYLNIDLAEIDIEMMRSFLGICRTEVPTFEMMLDYCYSCAIWKDDLLERFYTQESIDWATKNIASQFGIPSSVMNSEAGKLLIIKSYIKNQLSEVRGVDFSPVRPSILETIAVTSKTEFDHYFYISSMKDFSLVGALCLNELVTEKISGILINPEIQKIDAIERKYAWRILNPKQIRTRQ